MVTKFPKTEEDLRRKSIKVPKSELDFFRLVDALPDEWYVWHSVKWYNDADAQLGEADFLVFHPEYGFIVVEAKGGIIHVNGGVFSQQDTHTLKTHRLSKSPFSQAENTMYQFLKLYQKAAKEQENPRQFLKEGKYQLKFPLNFDFAVFFPQTKFKKEFEYLQYPDKRIFDETDVKKQKEWKNSGSQNKASPLEQFIVNLLDTHKHTRVLKPQIKSFFPRWIGSDIRRSMSLEKYYQIRAEELEEINEIQDFLLNALSEKKRCIFKGSAGSGKTYVAMKKAIRNYKNGIETLFICFNTELRDSVRGYITEQLEKPYERLQGDLDIYSVNAFLYKLIGKLFNEYTANKLRDHLGEFEYEPISKKMEEKRESLPLSYKYNAILVDEAQDIDKSLWSVLEYFLKDFDESLFYVFYDGGQAIFMDEFSPAQFGMEEKSDLILLDRNLRNTIEIAKYLQHRTKFGKYKEYSGINGFKISKLSRNSAREAIISAVNVIKKELLDEGIGPEKVTVLSNYRLHTLISDLNENEFGEYLCFGDQSEDVDTMFYLFEPKSIHEFPKIKDHKEIKSKWIILYKTISSFKGLESDIVLLIIPNIDEYKEMKPNRFKNFLMQVYVGASRAKFKLYIVEYAL
ncbi:MAG: NERD domain-containing protein [Promethearchaeia archaeon]